jgi:hypothetical protein
MRLLSFGHVVLGLFAAASPLSSQTAINGKLLPLTVDTFVVSYDGNVIGHGIMGRQTSSDGRLLQVYQWRSAGGEVIVDSLVSELPALRAIREVRVVGDTLVAAMFDADSIRVITSTSGRVIRQQSISREQALYSSASLESLIAAAPLRATYEVRFNVYYAPPSPLAIQPVTARVIGSERVDPGNQDAWIVEASTPGGATTFWIDKSSRAVLKYDVREGPAVIEFRR